MLFSLLATLAILFAVVTVVSILLLTVYLSLGLAALLASVILGATLLYGFWITGEEMKQDEKTEFT